MSQPVPIDKAADWLHFLYNFRDAHKALWQETRLIRVESGRGPTEEVIAHIPEQVGINADYSQPVADTFSYREMRFSSEQSCKDFVLCLAFALAATAIPKSAEG